MRGHSLNSETAQVSNISLLLFENVRFMKQIVSLFCFMEAYVIKLSKNFMNYLIRFFSLLYLQILLECPDLIKVAVSMVIVNLQSG